MHIFITKSLINKHADSGIKLIEIDKTMVVTSEAVDQAFKRGVTLKMVDEAACHMSPDCAAPSPERTALVQKIKRILVEQHGQDAPELEEIITKVLERLQL